MKLYAQPQLQLLADVVVVALLLVTPPLTHAQGLPRDTESVLAASNGAKTLSAYLQRAEAWRRQMKLRPSGACNTGAASLCAPHASDADDSTLIVATAPQTFDLRNSKDAEGVTVLSPVLDQGDCNTCTAFAVAAAAETAVAVALKKAATNWFSPQDFFFCSSLDPGTERSCGSSWLLDAGLAALVKRTPTTPWCLPYDPRSTQSCSRRCQGVHADALVGKFIYSRLTSEVDMQRWIRAHGPVLTGMQVYPDLSKFLEATPNAVYKGPGGGASVEQSYGHAVVLVGYNNEANYWVVRSSWGPKVGQQGYFKVAYGASGVADPSKSWGLRFQPFNPSPAFDTSRLSPAEGKPGCHTYKAAPNDYLGKVADRFNIGIKALLLDNQDVIGDPSALLGGKALLVCTRNVASFLPPSSQADALLRIKAAIDPNNVLASWFMGRNSAPGAYCAWRGVTCDTNNNVVGIRLAQDTLGKGASLGGVLPAADALLALPGLKSFFIGQQGLAGTLPDDYAKLTRLEGLGFPGNRLRGTLPASWASMQALQTLNFGGLLQDTAYGNLLEGTLPPQWGSLASLRRLHMHQNRLKGPLPPAWGKLRLELLQLGWNALTGSIPEAWAPMVLGQLSEFSAQNNQLSGPLPTTWGPAKALETLTVSNNALTGTLPASLAGIKALRTLRVPYNRLSGPLPATLGTSALATLNLQGNSFSGALPALAAPNLVWLYVGTHENGRCYGNKLSGPIPASLAETSPRLQELHLACNGFSGTLPAELGDLSELKTLDLGNNAGLGGTLPSAWGKLGPSLQLFNIGATNISGSIPASYGAWTKLTSTTWGPSRVSGCIPQRLAAVSAVARELGKIKGSTQISGTCY